jgi:hypothetical protein
LFQKIEKIFVAHGTHEKTRKFPPKKIIRGNSRDLRTGKQADPKTEPFSAGEIRKFGRAMSVLSSLRSRDELLPLREIDNADLAGFFAGSFRG